MFSDVTASCRALSGDLQANCLQLPVVLVSFVCIALVKRRCFESPLCRRHRTVWRWDVQRQLMASVAGFTVLIVFARGLQGSDCLNLIGLACTDLAAGTVLDGLLLWLFAAGGMRLGYYGQPPNQRTFAAQAAACTLISIAARSVSCCVGSLALTAVYKSHVAQDVDYDDQDMFYYVTCAVPGAYFVIRFCLLDKPHKAGYTRIRTARTQSAAQTVTSPIHVIGDAADSPPAAGPPLPHVDPSGGDRSGGGGVAAAATANDVNRAMGKALAHVAAQQHAAADSDVTHA
jgi:hypothetical protein